ncbi:MAG TPA: AbrB/MazE/SpoVT family DNA-binding domain-containing protein [Acidisarcina sp.]
MRSSAVIGPEGQIVIPVSLRNRYGFRERTAILFHEKRRRVIIEPRNYETIYALEGTPREFPIESDLEEESRVARKREKVR